MYRVYLVFPLPSLHTQQHTQVQFEGFSNAVGGVKLWILGAVHGAEKEKVSESRSRRAVFSFFLFQHQHCDLIHNRNLK